MHACGRSLLHGSFFNIIEAHAKTAHRSLVRSLNAVPLPVACRSAFWFCCCCEVILFHTPQRRTCTVVDAVFCMDRFSLNLIEAHAKTAHRSLVRSLNTVPLPVACRSAFCCCCEVILFHTPRRRTCTVVDAAFCMDRFSLSRIETHAKAAYRSLVRFLNAVPLPVACRSAFCCCCEVILFHTPQRRTCTLVDAVFCMDRFF